MTTFTASPITDRSPVDTREFGPRSVQAQYHEASAVRGIAAPQRPQRLVINGLLAALLGLVIIAAFVIVGGDAAADSPAPAGGVDTIEVYVVQPGDTLWGIAVGIAQPGDDVPSLVDGLSDLTGSASLEVGQRIVIDHLALRS